MAGLLNIDPLMFAAMGLLSNSGPSTTPQPFGKGLLEGLMAAQQAQAMQQQNAMQQMQMQQAQMQMQQMKSRADGMAKLVGGFDPNTGIQWDTGRQGMSSGQQMSALAQANPEAFVAAQVKAMTPNYHVVEGKIIDLNRPQNGFVTGADGKPINAKGPSTEIGKMLDEMGIKPDNPLYQQAFNAALTQTMVKDGVDFGAIGGPSPFMPGIISAATKAAATAQAETPALVQRAGGVAQAQLPAQAALATHNSNLKVREAGPIAQARLDAENAPVTVQTASGPVVAPAGKAAEVGQKSAEDRVKKISGANNVIALLDQVEPLLDKATGSMVGSYLDAALASIGKSTEGGNAIAQLKALEAALIQGMPRLEGPQSDRDAKLYAAAAGQIGDPMIPAGQKKAAIKTLRDIQSRYATIEPKQAASGIKFLGFE